MPYMCIWGGTQQWYAHLSRAPEQWIFLFLLWGDPVQNRQQNPASGGCLFSTRKYRSDVPERGDFGEEHCPGKGGVDSDNKRKKAAQKKVGVIYIYIYSPGFLWVWSTCQRSSKCKSVCWTATKEAHINRYRPMWAHVVLQESELSNPCMSRAICFQLMCELRSLSSGTALTNRQMSLQRFMLKLRQAMFLFSKHLVRAASILRSLLRRFWEQLCSLKPLAQRL